MTQWTHHALPRMRDVLVEQVRAVGLTIKREAVVTAIIALVLGLTVTSEIARGEVFHFHPEEWTVPGLIALLLPFAVWKRDKPFGPAFLWTVPVDRRQLALGKVFAGWLWLMTAVAIFVAGLMILASSSGGTILGEQTAYLLPRDAAAPLDPAALQPVRWNPGLALLLVPFTGATAMYLFGSALAVGLRQPLRWVFGTIITLFAVVLAADALGRAIESKSLIFAASRTLHTVIHGPYGLRVLLNSGIASDVVLPDGETAVGWHALPDPAQWGTTTFLWIGAGLIALWLAASRHRERRPT